VTATTVLRHNPMSWNFRGRHRCGRRPPDARIRRPIARIL